MKDVWKETETTTTSKNPEEVSKEENPKAVSKKRTLKDQSGRKTSLNKSLHPSSSSDLDSISKLLAAGEGVAEELAEACVEESKPTSPVVPKEGVEITIALPQHLRKKKKKGFDIAAFLKREMSRARRELAVLVHKSHLACLVANLMYLHTSLTTNMLKGLALSIVPEPHSHKPEQL